MKNKILLMAAALTIAHIAYADKQKTNQQTEEIEVNIESDNGTMTKKVIVNGKELNAEELKAFEASGKMKTLHMDHDGASGKGYKMIMINDDEHSDGQKHVKVIKSHSNNSLFSSDDESVEVTIKKDGDKTTEKIIVNGKELSEDEIAEFKASGKMKVIHLDGNMKDHGMMLFDTDGQNGDVDVEMIIEKLEGIEGKDGNTFIKQWHTDDGKDVKIFTSKHAISHNDSPSLGLVANVEDDGWHISKIIDDSGAKDAGLQEADVVIEIAGVSMAKSDDHESINKLPQFEEGEMVDVVAIRDGETLSFNIEARQLDHTSMSFDFLKGEGDGFSWIEDIKGANGLRSDVKVMLFDGKDGQYKLNSDDIKMVFPEHLSNMNIFVSDGQSTSKLLGKNHEMSAMTDNLSKYFHTNGGVLVLNVDESNVFGLQDGDVIKLVNGTLVNSPKEVVKALVEAEDQDNMQMKIVREKNTKTLNYNK